MPRGKAKKSNKVANPNNIKLPRSGADCKSKKNLKRKENKENLVILMGGKCVKCGYNKCMQALEFHHIDAKKKKFGLDAKTLDWSFKKIVKEAKKCLLVCCNCHREIHFLGD